MTYLHHLEGPLPARGEFVQLLSVQYAAEDQVPCVQLPAVHEPLVMTPERLAVACIADRCTAPVFINEVDVFVVPLFLHTFIKKLYPWGAQGYFRGKAGFGPVDQEERCLPGGAAGCDPVPPKYVRKLVNPFGTMFL